MSLWIQHLTDIVPGFLQSFMQYLTILDLDRIITALDCICLDIRRPKVVLKSYYFSNGSFSTKYFPLPYLRSVVLEAGIRDRDK